MTRPRWLALAAALLLPILIVAILPEARPESPLPDCEWCGAPEAPADLSWDLRIAPESEAGEPLELTGRIVRGKDRKPAAGVLLYAYHTNRKGVYPRRGNETGNARRHGYLRGWLRTGADGRYRIRTIRPGAYPEGGNPQHIHCTLTPPGGTERWIDDFHFADDPMLTPAYRSRLRESGGSGIVTVAKGQDGVWRGTRDIVLEE